MQIANNPQNAFTKLDSNWKNWVIECVELGCTTESMVEAMVKNGPFNDHLANNIIKAARCELQPELAGELETVCPRPDIATHTNHIELDRRIDILLTVNTPRIVVMANVLSHEECDALIADAELSLVRSLVVDAKTKADIEDTSRTSSYTMFQRGENDLLLSIEKRLAALANWPIEKGE